MKAHKEVATFLKRIALGAILLTSAIALANHFQTKQVCEGFLPENDMRIPVGYKSLSGASGLTETQFNAILDRAQKLYGPVIAKAGGKLKINRYWSGTYPAGCTPKEDWGCEDGETVNASAMQQGSKWMLNMYGGLARHPSVTEEGFALVVCHELGHHLGGAPKNKGFFGMNDWATNEGGADYYAGLKCLRDFFLADDNAKIVADAQASGTLSKFAADLCDKQFATDTDRLLCKRTSLGGTSVAGMFQTLKQEPAPPDYTKPDQTKTSKMVDKHPETQCRMDTYLAGAICDVDKTVALSDTDYRQGSCVENVAKLGFRPRCWFAP